MKLFARGLNRRRVEQLLAKSKRFDSPTDRIEVLSRQFLGHPYKANPLIGSADTPEVFSAALGGFDCVTYIETVLALSRASTIDEFIGLLRRIRYRRGRIEWRERNHYMTAWIRNNARDGILNAVTIPRVRTVSRDRILDVLPGLPVKRIRVTSIPKSAISRVTPQLRTGDLIFFASTGKHLDVFHAGIIVRDSGQVLMRHASRSKGRVVEQELKDFLNANRMAGMIVVRPRDARRGAA
jgi:Protein of unknown function (DUF1460)